MNTATATAAGDGALDESTESTSGAVVSAGPSAVVPLESLAPQYEESQHKTYLNRLEEAVRDERNRNIALTGRYGSGKSSVLDRFRENHKDTTLRLAISTLAPDPELAPSSDSATLTNRIEKELVKQLLYSASPRTLRHSRFNRITPLSTVRALGESAAAVATIGLLLALLDWLPSLARVGVGSLRFPEAVSWAIFACLIVLVATSVRLTTYNRFVVTDVSAGGASVTLSKATSTYFDEYLDEIVHYFDQKSVDTVIFEDLDRFNDPKIFEALRELNTILNNTPERASKGKPLRFVYAVRDSLFERLGTDTKEEQEDEGDAAVAETVRANRTKFFDIVIPLVPFISHRNARELLAQILEQAGITTIDRRLVDLIAQYATDMRLLRNMRNEYLVFAERLLESGKCAPGLTPTKLFALVAYKNFHLEDFEEISRRSSDLDRLYVYRRDLVRQSVAALERRKRDVTTKRGRVRSMAPIAKRLGERLGVYAALARSSSPYRNYPHLRYQVGSDEFSREEAGSYGLWTAVARAETVTALASQAPDSGGVAVATLNRAELEGLVPEALDAPRWEAIDEDEARSEAAQLDDDIAFLRGADFSALAGAGQFTVNIKDAEWTFAALVITTMTSDLARDLVKRGLIDRNFALYAAQFYGHFTGVDVATFIVQSVQTNTMDIDYRFTSPGAVESLLQETSEDFLRSVSAFNIDVLDHLLKNEDDRARHIVNQLVSNFDEKAQDFLGAYLNSGKQQPSLAAQLSSHPWPKVFTYVVSNENVPADLRSPLVDAALRAADPDGRYEFESVSADFIVEHYRDMPAFTQPQQEQVVLTLVGLLERAGVFIPYLEGVDQSLRGRLVERHLYQLTAPNLRAALQKTGEVTADRIHKSDAVYRYCLANPNDCLAAVEQDTETPHTVRGPDTLTTVLADVVEDWDDGQVGRLISSAAPESALPRVADAPSSTWPALAAAGLFRASLANLEAYRSEMGGIDEPLGHLLLRAGGIETDEHQDGEEVDKAAAALALLNARDAIPSPANRVDLVQSLSLDGYLPVDRIQPEDGDLLALLLEHGLVGDDADSFKHFHAAGWAALEPAFRASEHVEEFFAPELVEGMVAEIFSSPEVRERFGRQVVEALSEFVPDGDGPALTAAAEFALSRKISVQPDQVHRVAAAAGGTPNLVLRLLQIASPRPTAQELVNTLAQLGSPYDNVSTRTKTRFEVPKDDAHEPIFRALKDAGLCTLTKKRMKPLLIVQLT